MPVIQVWRRYWDRSIPAETYVPLRVGLGIMMFLSLATASMHGSLYFDAEMGLSVSEVGGSYGGLHLSWFDGLHGLQVPVLLGTGMVLALLFAGGVAPRFCGVLVFLLHLGLQHRMRYWMNGGDALLRCLFFFALLAPLGQKKGEAPGWPLRFCQLQMAVMYLATVLYKTTGSDWINGNALYYVMSDARYIRLPMDWLVANSVGQFLLRVSTWGTLAVELALVVVLLWPRWRKVGIAVGVLLHLGILATMRVGLFTPVVLVGYLAFLSALPDAQGGRTRFTFGTGESP
jgi:hypothetical protein